MTIYKSPWGDVQGAFYGNLASCILEGKHFKENPDKIVYIDAHTDESVTAAQVTQFSLKLNYLLKTKYQIRVDDVVNLFSTNSIHIPAIHYGILARGAIVSPANANYMAPELYHQLKLSSAKLVIVKTELKQIAEDALELGKHNVQAVVTIPELIKQVNETEDTEPIFELRGKQAVYKDAYYCFSSGTSGTPKAVMTTHFNIAVNIRQQHQTNPSHYLPTDVYAAIIPMSHIFGLYKLLYLCPSTASLAVVFQTFDFETFLKSIPKHKISTIHVVPPIMVLLAKSPLVEKYSLGTSLKYIFSGAAPLGSEVIETVQKRLGSSVSISQGYGLTETSPITHLSHWDPEVYTSNSIGWLVPGCEARLVDETGRDVPPGHRGELWIRGPQVTKGYLKNPDANRQTITREGFLKTGDVAVIDKTGQFYIVDRLKELIKSKGHQVAPAELEALLLSHPDIIDCAVIGVYKKEEATEYPRGYLVLREGANPQEILKWFNARVARHKRLWGGIVVVDAIPKTASGKILRRVLRDTSATDKVAASVDPEARL